MVFGGEGGIFSTRERLARLAVLTERDPRRCQTQESVLALRIENERLLERLARFSRPFELELQVAEKDSLSHPVGIASENLSQDLGGRTGTPRGLELLGPFELSSRFNPELPFLPEEEAQDGGQPHERERDRGVMGSAPFQGGGSPLRPARRNAAVTI